MEGIVAPTCPACRVVTTSAAWAHRMVANMCEGLVVRCNVCGWEGPRGRFVHHILNKACMRRISGEIVESEEYIAVFAPDLKVTSQALGEKAGADKKGHCREGIR